MLNLSFSGKGILTLDHKNTLSPFPMVVSLSLMSFQLYGSYVLEQRYHILLDWKINVVPLSDINCQEWAQKELLRWSLNIRALTINIPQLFGGSDIRLNVPVTLGQICQPNLQHCHRFTSFFFSFYSLSSLIRLWDCKTPFVPASNIFPSSRLWIHALPLL